MQEAPHWTIAHENLDVGAPNSWLLYDMALQQGPLHQSFHLLS